MLSIDGCLSIGFEREALFLSKYDFDYRIFPNSIRLNITGEDFKRYRTLDGKACRVVGIFKPSSRGTMFSGTLTVELISELSPQKR
jgi:hypothetical protein